MPQRAATIESLPLAFEVVKAMQVGGLDWGEGYRPLGRQALAAILEDGSAKATGDVRAARYVASQTKILADDLRTALKNSGETPTGEAAKQLATVAKQLNLLVVKARVGLYHQMAQYTDPGSRRAADSELRGSETALRALEAQIRGTSKRGVDIRA